MTKKTINIKESVQLSPIVCTILLSSIEAYRDEIYALPSQLDFLIRGVFLAILEVVKENKSLLADEDWDQIRDMAPRFGYYEDLPDFEDVPSFYNLGKKIQ